MASTTPRPTDATLMFHFNAMTSLDTELRNQIRSMLVEDGKRVVQISEALKQIPLAVPQNDYDDLITLAKRIDQLLSHKVDVLSLGDLSREHGDIMESLSRLSSRAGQSIRMGCLWVADETSAAGPTISVIPSLVSAGEDHALASYPRYLLRGQVQAETRHDKLARCSYTPGIGITSAKLALTIPSDLNRDEETYQQHLRFHCNGWYQKRGPTQWISSSDDPSWMVRQISNYGWRRGGHKMAFVDTQALARLHIAFAPSLALVLEANLTQYAGASSGFPELDEVKFATNSHWLIWSWIPDECVTWVDLDDFEEAHEQVKFRKSVSYQLTPHDSEEILERAKAIQRAREASRMPATAIKAQVVTTVKEVKGTDEVRHVEHAMQTLAVNTSTIDARSTRPPEPISRSIATTHASTQTAPEPEKPRPITFDTSTQTIPETAPRRPAYADVATQSPVVDPMSKAIINHTFDEAIKLMTPIIAKDAIAAAIEKLTPIITREVLSQHTRSTGPITATSRVQPSSQRSEAPATRAPTGAQTIPRKRVVVRLPENPVQPVGPPESERKTRCVSAPAASPGREHTGQMGQVSIPMVASDTRRPEAYDLKKSGDGALQANAAGSAPGIQASLLSIDEIDAELERMHMNV